MVSYRAAVVAALLTLIGAAASAQSTLAIQGSPAVTANAWPIKVTFGGAVIDPRLVTIQNATVATTQSGTWTMRLFDQSGNGLNSTANALHVNVQNASLSVLGPLTDTQLRATAVPVSGTVTVTDGAGALNVIVDSGTVSTITNVVHVDDNSGSITVDATALPLPNGAATSVLQGTGNTSLASIDGKLNEGAALPASTDDGTLVRVVPQERTTADTTLDTLDEAITIATVGMTSFGGQIDAGTCACTITFEQSFNNGASWSGGQVVRHDTGTQAFSVVLTNPHVVLPFSIYAPSGATNFRIRVSSYTSGSAVARLHGGNTLDPMSLGITSGVANVLATSRFTSVGGADSANVARRQVVDDSLPLTSDYGQYVRVVPQERTSGDTTLGALAATCSVDVTGFLSAGGRIDAGTFAGTLIFETSGDGGATWSQGAALGPTGTQVSSLTLTNPNSAGNIEFLLAGQMTNVRVRVSAYTSGSLVIRIRASSILSSQSLSISSGISNLTAPFYTTVIGGIDGSSVARQLRILNTANAGTEYAAVTQLSALGNTVKIDQTSTANDVDVLTLPALPAGTNAIGKLAANSGIDIGDVDVTSLPALVAGTALIGKVGIDQTTPGTTNRVDIGTIAAGNNNIGDVDVASIAAGNNNIGDVDVASITPPTLTKGTQGATGFSTQDLKDAGRVQVNYYAVATAAGSTGTETLFTLTKSSGTASTTTATTFVPTSGKKFRITSLSFATRGNATATIQTTTFNLRINTAGACLVSSTPIVLSARSATPATASAWDRILLPIPDGFEIAGDGTMQFCVSAAATYTTNAPTWDVTITGYEY